jgi:hypothetical protein
MLLKVIRKDLLLTRKRLLLNAGLFFVFLIVLVHAGDAPAGLFAWSAALMFSFVPVTVITQEDRCRAATVGCSLPVRRRDIVRARYLLGLGFGVAGVVAAFLLALVLPGSPYGASALFSPSTVLIALTVLSLSLALLLPFTIRFGLIGILVALVAFQVLGLVVLFLANRFGITAGVRTTIGAAAALVSEFHASLGDAGFFIAVLALLAALLALSAQASTILFERKEL